MTELRKIFYEKSVGRLNGFIDKAFFLRYTIIMKENYYTTRNLKDNEKISELLEKQLPPFCFDYFLGIESLTSCQTRLKYAYDLCIFFDFLCRKKYPKKAPLDLTLEDLEAVTNNDIELFLSYLSGYRYNGKILTCDAPAKSRKLSAVRAMFKYFFNKGYIEVNNAAKVATPKCREKEIIRLNENEVSELLSVAESGRGLTRHAIGYHDKTRVRDTAILTLFLGTGIRISELVGLNDDSVNFDDNSFVVTRKGGGQAILYFSDEVAFALKEYIAAKKNDPKIPENENALFLSMQYKRINVRSVEFLVKKYSKTVTPLKKITPHKLRSTYGTRLYNETGDIYVVADVLGHKDVNTTKRHYAAITQENRRRVAGAVKLHIDSSLSDSSANNSDETHNK